jgi:1,4-dihydroxy-2-naphthoyl-CoA synthase
MAIVETDRGDGVMVIRMNRPERLNALGSELRAGLAEAWCEFRDSPDMEVGIFTGTGRAFCAGEDMKETVERGSVARDATAATTRPRDNPYDAGTLAKPVIAAINGFHGAASCRRSAPTSPGVQGAIFEMSSEALAAGGFNHGFVGNISTPLPEMFAFGSPPSACTSLAGSTASWQTMT